MERTRQPTPTRDSACNPNPSAREQKTDSRPSSPTSTRLSVNTPSKSNTTKETDPRCSPLSCLATMSLRFLQLRSLSHDVHRGPTTGNRYVHEDRSRSGRARRRRRRSESRPALRQDDTGTPLRHPWTPCPDDTAGDGSDDHRPDRLLTEPDDTGQSHQRQTAHHDTNSGPCSSPRARQA